MSRAPLMYQVFALVLLSFCIYKKQFIQSDGISITILEEDEGMVKENYIFSTIWSYNRSSECFVYQSTRRSMYVLLLLICGDIEACPGPLNAQLHDFIQLRGIKNFHQNVCGLFTKFHSLEELFDRHENIDILALSATHIVNGQFNDNEDLYKIPGYMLVKSNRKVGKGGGVAIYILRNALSGEEGKILRMIASKACGL
ncbi:Hypothetical predicted protein, partial [Paramuricea clavata]